LNRIRQHLTSHGRLVIHVNHDELSWLGGLVEGRGTDFKFKGEYSTNAKKGSVRAWVAWSYEASTQTATAVDAWEFIDDDGKVMERKESPPKRLHCVFPFEMEHLLARGGFEVESLYGDFFRHKLENTSPDMIWVVRPGQP
jgi:hypothetical protein